MKFESNIVVLCKKKGWTLSKLSKESGVPAQTLHGWTTGRKPVNLDQVKKVATILEVSIHHLIFGEPDPFEFAGEEILKELFTGDVRVTLQRIVRKPSKGGK